MARRIRWDEQKRQSNLEKYGLDFRDAGWVLESRYRLDVPVYGITKYGFRPLSMCLRYSPCFRWRMPSAAGKSESSVLEKPARRNGRCTMNGLKTTSQTDLARLRATGDFAWDGTDEDGRPLSREEMQAGIDSSRRKRGRPMGALKESTTIRFDRDVLETFRASGPGWQTRMNAALRDWLKTHSPTRRS